MNQPKKKGGWIKYAGNPVLGGDYGVCFDVCVLRQESGYRMYFSWRDKGSIALAESRDGYTFDAPRIVLAPEDAGEVEHVNRPAVVCHGGRYHMWYTGQIKPGMPDGISYIFYAASDDGEHFTPVSQQPVIRPEAEWEKSAVMSPHVLLDGEQQLYKMWYSAGENYEPNAIGYAVSHDGLHWEKHPCNPVFTAAGQGWDSHKVAGCQVIRRKEGYIMFYIGYRNDDAARIGMACSKNGIDGWVRYPGNPIVSPDPGAWDGDACYKPYVLFDGQKWRLYYNGRKGGVEQIGLAEYAGADL